MTKMWLPVPGFPAYQVSDQGRVVSHKPNNPGKHPYEMRGVVHPRGYRVVCLRTEGKKWNAPIHQVVALAFHGPRPVGSDIRHLDGDKANNRADNLRYGSRSENVRDAIEHGAHNHARKTHCSSGHRFTEPPNQGGRRRCRPCGRRRTSNNSYQEEVAS